jgi:hypothetical protein
MEDIFRDIPKDSSRLFQPRLGLRKGFSLMNMTDRSDRANLDGSSPGEFRMCGHLLEFAAYEWSASG